MSFDVPSPQAVAVVLVYRLINFWLPIPVGFGSYLAIKYAAAAQARAW